MPYNPADDVMDEMPADDFDPTGTPAPVADPLDAALDSPEPPPAWAGSIPRARPALVALADADDAAGFDDLLTPTPSAVGAPAAGSDLDALREELAKTDITRREQLSVPARPGYSVMYRCDVQQVELDGWRNRAILALTRGGRKPADRDPRVALMSLCLCLAAKAEGIYRNGRLINDEQGEPMRFDSPEFLESCGKATGHAAVRHWYAIDGALFTVGNRVLAMSGWDEDEIAVVTGELDPTG